MAASNIHEIIPLIPKHSILPRVTYLLIFKNDRRLEKNMDRLSRSDLAIAYGQQVEFQGLIVKDVAHSSDSRIVSITYSAVSSIELRSPNGFEVCCEGSKCLNDTLWVSATVSSKNGLTITLRVNSSCVGQQPYGLRYLWHETPCLFKQAAIYSGTYLNLPSLPYLKVF